MKAVTRRRYGGPERLAVEEMPSREPAPGEVRVEVVAAGLNKADLCALRGKPFFIRFEMGLTQPRNPVVGADFAGRIDAVGSNVTTWRVGDAVYGDLSSSGWGAAAERIVVPATAVARAPTSIPLRDAAALPMAAQTAFQAVHDIARVGPGQRVLVHGASGGVGTFALQMARAAGARVEAVCSTSKAEQAKRLGADVVHDYTQGYRLPEDPTYDAILAVNGFNDIRDYERALKPRGAYVCIGGEGRHFVQAMTRGARLSRRTGKTLRVLSNKASTDRLRAVAALIDDGVVRPVIEERYPIERAADAYRHLAEGHATGKLILTIRE